MPKRRTSVHAVMAVQADQNHTPSASGVIIWLRTSSYWAGASSGSGAPGTGWKPGETTFADLLAGSRNSCIPLGWVKLPEEGAALEATMRRAAPKVELNPPKSSIVPERSEIVFLHRQGEKTLRP